MRHRLSPAGALACALFLIGCHTSHVAAPASITTSKAAIQFESGDLVRIRIWDLQGPDVETTIDESISGDGSVQFPLVGPIHLSGLNKGQAQAAIKKAYLDANLIKGLRTTVDRLDLNRLPIERLSDESFPVRLAAKDRLRIRLWDLVGPSSETIVQSDVADDGTISLPLIAPLKVAGLSEWQAMQAITHEYSKKQVLTGLQVTVHKIDGLELKVPS